MLRQIILTLAVVGIGTSRQISNDANLHSTKPLKTRGNVCQDKECKRLATFLLDNINDLEDPCEDFQKYACGNLPIIVPDKNYSENRFSNVRHEIREMLENPPKGENLKSLEIERKLYENCMQTATHSFENKLRFLSILQSMDGLRAFSPLPVSGFKKHWQESDTGYAMLGFKPAFFDIKIKPDIRNPSNNIITISPPLQRTSAKTIVETAYGINFTSELSAALNEVIKLNSDINDVQPQKRLEYEIISQFASNLEKIINPADSTRLVLGDVMTIRNWENLYNERHLPLKTKIIWLDVVNDLLSGNHISVNESETVYIEHKKYFKELAHLLKNVPTDVITAYVHLNYVYQAYPEANITEDDLTKHKASCLWSSDIVGAFHQYIKKHNLQENKKAANRIVERTREHLVSKTFEKWTNASSLAFAKYMMARIEIIVGYPESFHNRSYVENYYNDLEIDTNYFQNMVNYMGFIQRRSMARLRNPKLDPWIPALSLLTAVGDMGENEHILVFSVDLLRYPEFEVFNSKFPRSVNYGSLGTALSLFWFLIMNDLGDKSWNPGLNCFVNQLNTSIIGNEINENSERGGYRNMLFFNALYASYQLYESQQNEKSVKKVPGLEKFTDQQLFFLSFAHGICKSRFWWTNISANQVLYNFPEFTAAFQCPSDALLNGKHKCPASSMLK